MREVRQREGIFAFRRSCFGYHIKAHWKNQKTRAVLVLDAVSWVDPEEDTAGQVDLISDVLLTRLQVAEGQEPLPFWLLGFSHSVGDSMHHEARAALIWVDLFEDQDLAEKARDALLRIEEKSRKDSEFSDIPVLQYENWGGGNYAFSFSFLDNVFEKIDGVFLLRVDAGKVRRFVFGNQF